MTGKGWGDSSSVRRGRQRSTLLWMATLIVGGGSVLHTVFIVHDNSQRMQTVRLLLAATGRELLGAAANRLELLARDAMSCECPGSLPASRYFRVTVGTGARKEKVEQRTFPVDGAGRNATSAAVADSTLVSLAQNALAQPHASGAPRFRLSENAAFPSQFVVLGVTEDARGQPQAVSGFVTDAPTMAATLFESATTASVHEVPISGVSTDSSGSLVSLDTLSLQILDTSGHRLFGAIDATRLIRGSIAATGALAPLRLQLALTPHQLDRSLITGVPRHELWLLGALQACTLVLFGLSLGSARREMLLARARSDFVAGVSHDLRMPLAQILLSSETLDMNRARSDGERRALVTSIVRESRRLVGLIDNVLLFARSGAVHLNPMLTPVVVSELFADALDSVQLVADDLQQTIDVDDAGQCLVIGERHLLRQAIVNLLDNALKYGPPGQHVQLRAVMVTPARIQIQVDDQGIGIPAAELNRVFEPYARLERDQTSERTGTGLGLSVVREVASACHGRAWLEALPSSGTRAILELSSAGSA